PICRSSSPCTSSWSSTSRRRKRWASPSPPTSLSSRTMERGVERIGVGASGERPKQGARARSCCALSTLPGRPSGKEPGTWHGVQKHLDTPHEVEVVIDLLRLNGPPRHPMECDFCLSLTSQYHR